MKKSAYLAAGCFWGVEDLLRNVPGVLDTEVGYTGGQTADPTYEDVKIGRTGHAEAIRVDYDAAKLTYPDLLRLFFKLHDPTTRNRQGNDIGTQYRSAIFFQDEAERQAAEDVIREISGSWKKEVTTTLEPFDRFYSAETYHQDYLKKHPGGYTCHYWR
jgi:methionine-S-sulfoxide reductase